MSSEAEQDPRARRDAILAAMLAHVVFDGWTMKTLRAGAVDAGFRAEDGLLVFPGGPAEAAGHYCDMADRRMLAELETRDLAALKVRERIAMAVRVRLELAAREREAVRRLIAYLSLPFNASTGARCTYNAVDAIWRAAGDSSTDWNFYTKRGLLAGVYVATVLYWLSDTSDDFEDTWDFLDRRLADVLQIPRIQARAKQAMSGLGDPLRRFRRAGAASMRRR